jgi:hypothetical protein
MRQNLLLFCIRFEDGVSGGVQGTEEATAMQIPNGAGDHAGTWSLTSGMVVRHARAKRNQSFSCG